VEFVSGRIIDFIALVVIWGIAYYTLELAKRGKTYEIQNMPPLDAIYEGVGSALEKGKKTLFIHCGKLYGSGAPAVMACFSIANYTAEHVARLNAGFTAIAYEYPEVYPILLDNVRQGFAAADASSSFRDEMVVYFPGWSYTMETMGLIEYEKPGAILFMGRWDHSALIQSTVGQSVGAFQIAGATNVSALPFFVANCDFVLIGEELLAAGAKVSGIPSAINTIFGEDVFRIVILILLIVGFLTASLNIMALKTFLAL
jgi:hypothetical protein